MLGSRDIKMNKIQLYPLRNSSLDRNLQLTFTVGVVPRAVCQSLSVTLGLPK